MIYDFKSADTASLLELIDKTPAEELKKKLIDKAERGITANQYDLLCQACNDVTRERIMGQCDELLSL